MTSGFLQLESTITLQTFTKLKTTFGRNLLCWMI
jgi:hypothetical protein